MNTIPEGAIKACKMASYIGAGILLSIFILAGLVSLMNGEIKGILFIIISVAAGFLVYYGAEESCRRNLTGPINLRGNGLTINFG